MYLLSSFNSKYDVATDGNAAYMLRVVSILSRKLSWEISKRKEKLSLVIKNILLSLSSFPSSYFTVTGDFRNVVDFCAPLLCIIEGPESLQMIK